MSTVYNSTNLKVQSSEYVDAEVQSDEVDITAKKVEDAAGSSFWWSVAGATLFIGALELVCHIIGVEDHPEDNDKDLDCTGSYESDAVS